jgi:hypothetical protein
MDTPLPIRSGSDATSDPPVNSAGKWNGFTVVRIILGILLLVAAGLKFTDNGLGAEGGFGPFASPLWRLAIVEAEALLGVWLMLGLAPRVLWLVTLLFFSLLASASLHLGFEGQPSCGCFGTKLPVRPWYSFAVDLASVAALVWQRPRQKGLVEASHWVLLWHVLSVIAGSAVILVIAIGMLAWLRVSSAEMLSRLRGESVTVEPLISDVGEGWPGLEKVFTVQITNHENHPIRLVGGTSDCSCVTTENLPITIPAHDTAAATIRARYKGPPGIFEREFILLIEDGQTTMPISGRFKGRLVDR